MDPTLTNLSSEDFFEKYMKEDVQNIQLSVSPNSSGGIDLKAGDVIIDTLSNYTPLYNPYTGQVNHTYSTDGIEEVTYRGETVTLPEPMNILAEGSEELLFNIVKELVKKINKYEKILETFE